MEKNQKRFIYIIYGIIINMCLGSIYSWSIFKAPLEELLKIKSTASGMPFMFFLMSYAITMPLIGGLIPKFGPKIITLVGGAILGIAYFISGFTSSIFLLTITYGILGGIGVGVVYGIPIAVAAKWFPKKKGLAVGLALAGFGLSPFVTAPLSRYFIEKLGVFSAFKVLGIIYLIILIIIAFQLKFPDENIGNDKKIKS